MYHKYLRMKKTALEKANEAWRLPGVRRSATLTDEQVSLFSRIGQSKRLSVNLQKLATHLRELEIIAGKEGVEIEKAVELLPVAFQALIERECPNLEEMSARKLIEMCQGDDRFKGFAKHRRNRSALIAFIKKHQRLTPERIIELLN